MSEIQRLRDIMARLRAPDGCPWDREQTHQTLCPHLIEECCELLDTIDRGDLGHMCEELGDVLLQVVFHAQLASETGHFNFDDVARGISDKLVRRHPHVFGDNRLETSDEVLHQWDKIKAGEKPVEDGERQPLVKLSHKTLPALLRAVDAYKQLVKKDALPVTEGLVDEPAVSKLAEGLSETEAGKKLFAMAAACRRAGVDPESALRRHTMRVVAEAEKGAHE